MKWFDRIFILTLSIVGIIAWKEILVCIGLFIFAFLMGLFAFYTDKLFSLEWMKE